MKHILWDFTKLHSWLHHDLQWYISRLLIFQGGSIQRKKGTKTVWTVPLGYYYYNRCLFFRGAIFFPHNHVYGKKEHPKSLWRWTSRTPCARINALLLSQMTPKSQYTQGCFLSLLYKWFCINYRTKQYYVSETYFSDCNARKIMQFAAWPSLIHLLEIIYPSARPVININQADNITRWAEYDIP